MLSILIFFLIYAGVSIAVYQLYDIYHSQNFADEEKRARIGKQEVNELAFENFDSSPSPELKRKGMVLL